MLSTQIILLLIIGAGFLGLFVLIGLLRGDHFRHVRSQDDSEHRKKLLAKVRRIEIKTNKITDHLFSGEYHSSFKGSGMSFAEVRKYSYGDDIRRIDWNVTARLNEPYVKIFEEERELTFYLLIDISASASYGLGNSSKREYMAEVAATLAFAALKNGDKVGLLLFSNRVERFLPAKKGRQHVLHIIRDILETQPEGKATDLADPLRFFADTNRKKAIAFILSDFHTPDFSQQISYAASRHDISAIKVTDSSENEIPETGLVPVVNVETGERSWMDSNSRSLIKKTFSF